MLLLVPKLEADQGLHGPPLIIADLFGGRLFLLLAILAYQTAASGIWAYVSLIGLSADIPTDDVSLYIAISGMLGLAGALLPVINGKRFGRLYWVLAGAAVSICAALMLTYSFIPSLYIGAMVMLFFAWPAVLSYLLAVSAEFDPSGQLSTIANVVSSLGLATGPLLGASLLDDGNYSLMLYSCAGIFLVSLLVLYKPVQMTESDGGMSQT